MRREGNVGRQGSDSGHLYTYSANQTPIWTIMCGSHAFMRGAGIANSATRFNYSPINRLKSSCLMDNDRTTVRAFLLASEVEQRDPSCRYQQMTSFAPSNPAYNSTISAYACVAFPPSFWMICVLRAIDFLHLLKLQTLQCQRSRVAGMLSLLAATL